MGELSSVIVQHCSCYLSSWRYLTLIDIFEDDDGARFTVERKCDVLEARKKSHTNSRDLSKDLTSLGTMVSGLAVLKSLMWFQS